VAGGVCIFQTDKNKSATNMQNIASSTDEKICNFINDIKQG